MIELANFVLDVLGTNHPINVDTNIAKHNIFLEDSYNKTQVKKFEDEDTIVIKPSKKTGKITKQIIRKFLNKFGDRYSNFQEGRSYFFEYLKRVDDNNYEIIWGS